MVVANGHVDLDALKSRHPLGDVVEAAGVRLRGRGRVRQGVCPFHDEAEGSSTVYGDTERFHCFGCGATGDVLDFIQRTEGLSLPEAIQRLGGGAGLVPGPAIRSRAQAPPRRATIAAVVPQRDPGLLTAALRFYLRSMLRSSEGRGYLGARGISFDTACRLGLGYATGDGLRRYLEAAGFGSDRLQASGLFTEQGERFAGMVVVPDLAYGRVRWLVGRAVGPDVTPRFQALPGPKPVLGLGGLGRGASWVVVAEGLSTGLHLSSGACPPSPPWAPRAWSGWRRPCLGAAASSSPSTQTLRAMRRRSGLRACLEAGPLPCPCLESPPTWPSLPPIPRAAPPSSTCLHGRPTPSGRPLLPQLTLLAPALSLKGHPFPVSHPQSNYPSRSYAQCTTGFAPPTGFPIGARTGHEYTQATQREGETTWLTQRQRSQVDPIIRTAVRLK